MSISTEPQKRTSDRLPLLVFVLAAGTFLMGTTEFVVAGILPEIASDLGITVSHAALMITVFAVGMIVGTPLMAVLTLRLPRRVTLSLSLLIFAVGHVIVAVSTSFPVILGARFVTALATGAFWAVAAVVGAQAAGPQAASRALGIVLGGGMLANVLGVPLGAFTGQAVGWRGPFWVLAVIAAVGAAVVFRSVGADTDPTSTPSLRTEFAALKDTRVWLALAGCAIVCASSLSVYSFIAPIVTENTGLPSSAVPALLVVYGLGALAGSYLGGRIGAEHPYRVLFVSSSMTFAVLVGLLFLSNFAIPTVILIAMLGLFGMSTNPVLIGKVVGFASAAPTLASALSTSAFNAGTAAGSAIAGVALASSLGPTGPIVVGAAAASLYLLPLALLRLRDRTQQ
ncbi:MFS transporter [Tsukamurella sp. PLM1]|uniref:MFS transporter n=1 Tax=Tsukamurella sp. PLM1 TaxID=2929795 RepID=UPI00204CE809|nr:MFS transporter [Tsukamurella sp. PLM1]BDH59101.1 MFS transporter [Tsukamurella sp. PLM1]